ncbi:hypothetical protein MIR68_012148 [Amoeboaphelidium protococcarum]|nr:hypothetical protein MIR68_012148 [Amoeboaphelidium protococcarum]
MKIFHTWSTINHPWQQVTIAQWRKYPNEFSPQVLHVDILDRHINEKGQLVTERLIACQQPLPSLFKRFFNVEDVILFKEFSIVDPIAKEFKASTQNITYADLVEMKEDIAYMSNAQGNDGDNECTRFDQTASVESVIGGYQRVKNQVEEFCVLKFKSNAERGRGGLEFAIQKIFSPAEDSEEDKQI